MASSPLGTASLFINTNYGGLITGLNQAGNSIGGWIKSMSDKVFMMSQGMSGAMMAVGVPPTLATQIQQVAQEIDDAAKNALRLGVPIDILQGLNHHATLAGSSSEDLAKGMRQLGIESAKALSGDATSMRKFEELGISLDELNASSPDQLFMRVGDSIRAAGDESERLRLANELFGRQALSLMPTLVSGSEAMAASIAEAGALGITVDPRQAAMVEELNDNWSRVQAAIKGVVTTLLVEFGPILSRIAVMFVNVWVSVRPAIQVVATIVSSLFTAIIDGLQWVWDNLQPVIVGFGAVAATLLTWNGIVAAVNLVATALSALATLLMAHPIFLIAAIVAAIVAAFADWGAAMDGLTVHDIIDMIRVALETVGNIGVVVFGALTLGASYLVSAFGYVVKAIGFVMKAINKLTFGLVFSEAKDEVMGFADSVLEAAETMRESGREMMSREILAERRPGVSAATRAEEARERRHRESIARIDSEIAVRRERAHDLFMSEFGTLDVAFQSRGLSDIEARIFEMQRLRGMEDFDADRLRESMRRNAGAELIESLDPSVAARRGITGLRELALGDAAIDPLTFARHADRQLREIENSLGIGGPRRTSSAVFKGSSADIEANIRRRIDRSDASLTVEERIARIAEESRTIERESADYLRDIVAEIRAAGAI